eukprot:2343829-Pleurochrysis_carterae.AAC.3
MYACESACAVCMLSHPRLLNRLEGVDALAHGRFVQLLALAVEKYHAEDVHLHTYARAARIPLKQLGRRVVGAYAGARVTGSGPNSSVSSVVRV